MKRRLIGVGLVLIIAIIVLPMLLSKPKPSNDNTMVKTVTLPADSDSGAQSNIAPAQQPTAAAGQKNASSSETFTVPKPVGNPGAQSPSTPSQNGQMNGVAGAPQAASSSNRVAAQTPSVQPQPENSSMGGAEKGAQAQNSQSAQQPVAPPAPKSAPSSTANVTRPKSSQTAQAAKAPSAPESTSSSTASATRPKSSQTTQATKAPKTDTGAASGGIPAQPIGPGVWGVQVGSFSDAQNAEAVARQLSNKEYRVFVAKAQVGDLTVHRVRVGAFQTQDDAQRTAQKISDQVGHAVQVLHVR